MTSLNTIKLFFVMVIALSVGGIILTSIFHNKNRDSMEHNLCVNMCEVHKTGVKTFAPGACVCE